MRYLVEYGLNDPRGLCVELFLAVERGDAVTAMRYGKAVAEVLTMLPELADGTPELVKALLVHQNAITDKLDDGKLEELAGGEASNEYLTNAVRALGEERMTRGLMHWLLNEHDAVLAGQAAYPLAAAGAIDELTEALLECRSPKAKKAVVEMVTCGLLESEDALAILSAGLQGCKDPSVKALIEERLGGIPEDGKRPRTALERLGKEYSPPKGKTRTQN